MQFGGLQNPSRKRNAATSQSLYQHPTRNKARANTARLALFGFALPVVKGSRSGLEKRIESVVTNVGVRDIAMIKDRQGPARKSCMVTVLVLFPATLPSFTGNGFPRLRCVSVQK